MDCAATIKDSPSGCWLLHLVAAITDLIKKDQFAWSETTRTSFRELKRTTCTCPFFVVPDFLSPLIIECDASDQEVGAVLLQQGRPIAFESRKLNKKKMFLSIYNNEMLAVIHALTKLKQYLVCGLFTVRTYHNSLRYILFSTRS